MTDDEFDYFNWRLDNLSKMIADVAETCGHLEMAMKMTQFHNENVIAENKRLLELRKSVAGETHG